MNGCLASWQILALFIFALLKTRWLAQQNQGKCVRQIKTKLFLYWLCNPMASSDTRAERHFSAGGWISC